MFLENCKFKGTFRKYQAEVLKEFDKHIKNKCSSSTRLRKNNSWASNDM